MADLISMLAAAAGAAAGGGEVDPNFNQTVLLLHGDGTDGAQNNTFLDSSTNNFTITRNGNTTQGTFSPFSAPDGRWSNYFDASTEKLATTGMTAAGDDFTLECWIYPTSFANYNTIYDDRTSDVDANGFVLGLNAAAKVYFYTNSSFQLTTTTALSANEWYHIALVRSGSGSNNVKIYINGVADATTATYTTEFTRTAPSIGCDWDTRSSLQYFGYISNLRLTSNGALYASGFTPSANPLTTSVSSGTVSLLTCQSNRYVDNSSSPKTITISGTPSVTPFGPFAPTAAYSPSVNGGSMYQIGTTDYVQSESSADVSAWSTDFTIECWIYPTALSGTNCIWTNSTSNSDGMTAGYTRDGRIILGLYGVNETVSATGLIKNNTWHHVAWVRSGSNVNIYLNGVSVATPTTANLETTTTKPMTVGGEFQTTGDTSFPGYISGFRVLKGTAIDFSSTGVPTAPYQASDEADTTLLLNFTNAGIFDNTGKNNLETVADAQVDTSVVKFGTGSMEFDGTGDYLLMKGGESFAFGTGDFTIEFWVNTNQTATEFAIIDFRTTNGAFPLIAHDSTRGVFYYLNTNYRIESNTVLTTGVWYHIAVARSGSSTKLFINGTQAGSTFTDSTSLSVGANRPIIGTNGENVGTLPLNGYIDDLRITKGVARYTTDFDDDLPTKAFPDL
jgi:hypothetical protein